MELDVLLQRVVDRETFFAFVRALIADRTQAAALEKLGVDPPYSESVGGWKTASIEGYLEAALAGAEAKPVSGAADPSWRTFAEFLYCVKIYE